MKKRTSPAWEEIGYVEPAVVNAEIAQARQRDRQEHEQRKAEQAAVPVRRKTAREFFAAMHAAVDGGVR